jgi:hypothetical protein
MSRIRDAVIDARDDEDEAQMRLFFYGSNGFDSEDEVITSNPSNTVIDQVDTKENDFSVSVSSYKIISDVELSIRVQECKQRGIAHQVWPAATFLSEYIVQNPLLLVEDVEPIDLNEVIFLELGAGLGVTGIYLTKYFAGESSRLAGSTTFEVKHTVLTDLGEALSGLQNNININRDGEEEGNISADVLSWGNETELLQTLERLIQHLSPLTDSSVGAKRRTLVVLAADVIYWECLFDPLIECLTQLLQHTGKSGQFSTYFSHTRVIIAHYKRWKKDQAFINRCQKRLQKTGLGVFECLHEDVAPVSSPVDELENGQDSEMNVEKKLNFSTKKEIRRIYLIKSI